MSAQAASVKASANSLNNFVIEISLKKAGGSGNFLNANYALEKEGQF